MIRELHIKNLALIDDVSVVFEKGFTVFTGETGAGKSILVGAVGLLLGERAFTEHIRSGAAEAHISGLFDLSGRQPALCRVLEELNIPADDNTLVIHRRIQKNGRNSVAVNQIALPLSSLKKIGDFLIDLHGQHDHQLLLNPQTAAEIIDTLSGVAPVKERYRLAYARYVEAKNVLAEQDRIAAELAQRRDFIEFQLKELTALNLKTGEEQRLEEELKLVSSSTQRITCAQTICKICSQEADALDKKAGTVRKNIQALAQLDPSVQPWIAEVENAASIFNELEKFCGSYLEGIRTQADPGQIDAINDRIAKIQRLKKKYHCSGDELIQRQEQLKQDLDKIENKDADRELLEKSFLISEKTCLESGRQLSEGRKKEAESFDNRITDQMKKLGFSGGGWQTEFTPLETPGAGGFEECQFMVRTNVGEPFLPLVKTASGGEISRLMLAIKSVLARQDMVGVLVFDEIDTGIGGLLAHEVASCLSALSKTHQVLCITHLQQIASRADNHFRVYKKTTGQRTVTRVELLDKDEKVREIARMLGSDTETAKKHAEELLNSKK